MIRKPLKPGTPTQGQGKSVLEEDIAVHIFSASAAMVGVCLTVIGIIRVIIQKDNQQTIADDMLAVAALLFLVSCGLSYWALRTRHIRRMVHIEKIADFIFIIALCIMAVVCFIITYYVV